jgi:hypothetical protein
MHLFNRWGGVYNLLITFYGLISTFSCNLLCLDLYINTYMHAYICVDFLWLLDLVISVPGFIPHSRRWPKTKILTYWWSRGCLELFNNKGNLSGFFFALKFFLPLVKYYFEASWIDMKHALCINYILKNFCSAWLP